MHRGVKEGRRQTDDRIAKLKIRVRALNAATVSRAPDETRKHEVLPSDGGLILK
jgi:hypothetical protein